MLPTTALLRCRNVFEGHYRNTAFLLLFYFSFDKEISFKGCRGSTSLAEEASSTHSKVQCQRPINAVTQTLKLADAATNTARLVAQPHGSCHFILVDNLLSLEITQITASEQKPRRKPHNIAAQSFSWAGGSTQGTCFGSPYIAQSSLQTVFQ